MKRALVVLGLVAAPLLADDVFLRGGGRISGQIVARTDDTVTVDVGGGTLSVGMASVVRIDESVSPVQQYRERAAAIAPGDAEAWRDLARWARGEALATMAGDAWSHVVAVLPDDEEANLALGRVRLDGRWVSEEESYRARGYVEFEGGWVTPAERQAILDDRRTREDAYRKAESERLAAEQQQRQEQKAREDEERKQFLSGGLPQYGDPLYWGSGVVYWPAAPVTPPSGGR